MKKYIFFILLCYTFHTIYSQEFIYPVASLEDENKLFIIYQKSLHDVQLWMQDTKSNHFTQALSSFITPANLRILPSGDGFSFIDAGYIKIQEFAKRSPRTLPIYEPIGLFSSMNWIDQETFYFVAREGDFFQIFEGNLQANIKRLTYDAADALYPQKIGSDCFYIKRDQDNQFSIMRKAWNPIEIDQNCKETDSQKTMTEHADQQICFLKMITEDEGFFLQAPTKKLYNQDTYRFLCYHLIQNNTVWTYEKIFEFQIPAKYITGLNRLYESIEPFLPNYSYKNFVYFVSWKEESDRFDLLKFDMIKKTIEGAVEQSFDFGQSEKKLFAPYMYQNKIYYGLILDCDNIEKVQKNFLGKLPCFELK